VRVRSIINVNVEVARQNDITAVDSKCLQNRRQFSEEQVADWLTARTVEDDKRKLHISCRQDGRYNLERSGRDVKLQTFRF